jgi:DNA polymerase III delta prime subunit
MFYGYDNLVKDFKRLTDSRSLSHAYLFFGEPQVGKFLFAKCLANYIENGKFSEPKKILNETLLVDFSSDFKNNQFNKESVGIDAVREVERFLYQTAISSPYRMVIIRDAEWLTDLAQSALLKILEEPPQKGLIIITARDKAIFLPTIASRMQAIYFKTLPDSRILDFLVKYGRISDVKAKTVTQESFGRIGRAIEISNGQQPKKDIASMIREVVSTKTADKKAIENIIDELLKIFEKSPELLNVFFEEIVKIIRPFVPKKPQLCENISQEIAWMESLVVNKRIHLKNILWTTKFILSDS